LKKTVYSTKYNPEGLETGTAAVEAEVEAEDALLQAKQAI
jgi:hypothetical protein